MFLLIATSILHDEFFKFGGYLKPPIEVFPHHNHIVISNLFSFILYFCDMVVPITYEIRPLHNLTN